MNKVRTLLKELKKEAPAAAGASWPTVFGDDADEFFQAYWVAHYVGRVAAAGKNSFSAGLLEPGYGGAVESWRRLLELCDWDFNEQYLSKP